MSHPLLFLHGIRGARLAIHDEGAPRIIWELAEENHPLGHLLALHHTGQGEPEAADPARPVFPLDHEPEVYGPFLTWAAARGPLIAPVWDWRREPARAAARIAGDLPRGPLDVVIHSMGLHVLGELVMGGALPVENIRRLVLAAPAIGGALDILHVLLSGCDRESDGGDATGRSYGHLVRSLPSLYRLLPVPGYGLLVDEEGRDLDPLELEAWPADALGVGERHRQTLARLLADARRDRARQLGFAGRLADLGPRVQVVSGQGQPTPHRCRMIGGGMSCHRARLELEPGGDGRLTLAAQQPLGRSLSHMVFGTVAEPLPHGEILRRAEVLEHLGAFLD